MAGGEEVTPVPVSIEMNTMKGSNGPLTQRIYISSRDLSFDVT